MAEAKSNVKEPKALVPKEQAGAKSENSMPSRDYEGELKAVREQATMISKSYLDMRDTARDMAAIIEAQGRLFKKLPGIAEIQKN